ncbi:phosphopeptide-binding protein [Mycolicibacterium monacense]|uniref:DUF7159 domain-containing protein n=2 Tax=Mycobacteriaceae TaxID=1762 RepID=A0AAD1IX67_MYCMB|nr:phosphopeptide-binding protein [Mycolicibacterium monacense]MDA4100366.1 hypothetical protein [Mycolicibacterium monacense DSM 44395]ORB22489.1 hypothetical protein BST34_07565 [Mycolicibacterium monacense DSM 44395]QHP84647.1 hypothetical protein EWR22_04255 [Mycolicibacterium monacense DSM 44395]BBZ62576.1 hypothetical protein MMON_38770 [Mycolicibacterium monacense]
MDVTLGVVLDKAEARIALLDATAPHAVIDQSAIDLSNQPVDAVVSALASTDRMLTESGHRLVGTSVCSADPDTAAGVRDALIDADLTNVTVVSRSDAVTEVTRSLVGGDTTATLTSDADTAALTIVDAAADTTSLIAVEPVTGGDRGAAYRTLLERFGEEPGGATSVIVLGAPVDDALTADLQAVSPVPLQFVDDPESAIARGAALAGTRRPGNSVAGQALIDSMNWGDTMLSPQAQQLAYSQVDDAEDFGIADAAVPMQTPMRPLSAVDSQDYEVEESAEEAAAPADRPRALLLGSTVAAVVVVGFAALAVTVALNIRPDVREQAVRLTDDSLAGKYFPVAPGQGVTPDGPGWTMIEEVPPPGVEPEARTFRPQMLNASRGTGDAGAEVIKLYRDGTVGVVPDATQFSAAIQPQGIVGPGSVPDASGYVTRLIPDFTRWSPCQVLALVGNMRLLSQTAIDAVAGTTSAGLNAVNSVAGNSGAFPDLSDLGRVALVPQTKGELFDVADTLEGTSTDINAIPPQIFKTGAVDTVAKDVLPVDTKIVDTTALQGLVPTGGPGEGTPAPILGGILSPEVGESLPGTKGTRPVIDPGTVSEGLVPGSGVDLPEKGIDVSSVLPGDGPPSGSTPPVNIPGAGPSPDGPVTRLNPGGIAPEVGLPKPEVGLPKPAVELPKPAVELPKPPPVDLPDPVIELPKPSPKIPERVLEAPEPPVVIPEPKFEIPVPDVPEVPVYEPPSPPVQQPSLPSFELPKLEIPTFAPEPEAPAAPSVPDLPSFELPELPFGGGLFGSGSN